MGTPNFMAPEQAEGKVGEIDARTDVFALGGILYNLLTLRAPAEGTTAAEALEKIRRGYIAPPVYYNRAGTLEPDGSERKAPLALAHCPGGKVPAALSAVAMKALSVRPQERYQSVAELEADITAYQNGFATMAQLPGPLTLLRLWVRRHKKSFAVAVSVAAILAVAATLVTMMWWELRGTASVFFDKAQALVSQQRFEEALAPMRYALRKMPRQPAYWAVEGNILESLLRVDEARAAYQRALGLRADYVPAERNLAVCARILRDNQGRGDLAPSSLALLESAMREQGRKEEAGAMLKRVLAQDEAQRTVFYRRWRKQLDQARLGGALTIDDSGRVNFCIKDTPVIDLSALRGIPLNSLELENTKVKNPSALRGMPLERLLAGHVTGFEDLTPLKGMPLRDLRLNASPVTSLAPLAGMSLESLDVACSEAIGDLRPLQGMPLQYLCLWDCPRVKDLGPLRAMRLKGLNLTGTSVTDLRPVLGAPIGRLELQKTPFTEFSILTNLPLETLDLRNTRIKDLSPLSRLTGLADLWLDNSPVSDLRPLSLPGLRSLALNGTQVSDLTPLVLMALGRLDIDSTKVTDLRPLRGKAITGLSLAQTQVTDLSPIQDLPLETLFLEGCDKLMELGALTNLHRLRTLTIPAQTKDIDFLRRLPNLREVGFSRSLLLAPDEFRRTFEAKKAGSATLAHPAR